ncbi:MAG: ABC transporter permease [Chloroflexi bacterium]|nr:ABC transporter permease [Chloroflexota bacterium]
MNSLELQSKGLYEQYEQSAIDALDVVDAEPLDEKAVQPDEVLYAASQWQLMWRKFRRNRVAFLGGVIILIYYVCALAPGFFAPYPADEYLLHGELINQAPQRIRLMDDGRFMPHIYKIAPEEKPEPEETETPQFTFTPGRVDLEEPEAFEPGLVVDETQPVPIKFFARGYDYNVLGLFETDIHLFQPADPEAPIYFMGTDDASRDMFSRIIHGAQISLSIGLIGVVFSLVFGTVLGIASGYYGGVVDDLIQRLIELVRSFPTIPLWMALFNALPPHMPMLRKYFLITLILSLIGWTWLARQLRGKVLSLRNEEFVTAAKLAGASDFRIIFRHLLPATFSHIVVVSTLALPAMILAETALSYLGLGLQPPTVSWGVLLNEAGINAVTIYPWQFAVPAISVAIAILAFNFLGDGLRDASDPYSL